ncbi:hypothetical protein BH11PLA2_BH11PLA2_38140 [soil metagenome]
MSEGEVFMAALSKPAGRERAAYMAEACASNAPLRIRVEGLLRRHEETQAILDQSPAELLKELNHGEDPLTALRPHLEPTGRPDSQGRLKHYEVLAVLGQGGFGVVLKAFDESLQRLVAIKVLHPHLALTSPPRKRFLREARAAAAIRHENVVLIHAVEESPLPFLVMEYIEGQTLESMMHSNGPFEPAEVIRIGVQVSQGLAAAHERNLIHRDIKPANLLLENGPQSRILITDFGLARTQDAANMTGSNVVAGTPLYMAPEQVRGDDLDQRTDLFCLGSVLYTLCVGHPPFRAESILAVMKRVADDEPRPIPQNFPDVPAGLCSVITQLLQKDPANRFQTAGEVAIALSECMTKPMPMATPRAIARSKTSSKMAYTLLGALLVGITAVTILYLRPKPDAVVAISPVEPAAVPPPVRDSLLGLPLGVQIKTVKTKLKEVNPDLDESLIKLTIENGAIVKASLKGASHLYDLSPLGGLMTLRELDLSESSVSDLKGLAGLKLERVDLERTPILDLSPLSGMPIKLAAIGHTNLRDLTPFKGMPLETLFLHNAPIESLTPIQNCPLKMLDIRGTKITDFTPLRSMPLEDLNMTYDPEKHAALLRSIPSLRFICNQDAATVLDMPDKPAP